MFNRKFFTAITLFPLMALAFMSAAASAEDMNAERFIDLDIQARKVTLEGVRDRLTLLVLGADMALQIEHDKQTQQAVNSVYLTSGTSVAQAVRWAGRNKTAIVEWLAEHPELQTEYDQISRALEQISTQIQTQIQTRANE